MTAQDILREKQEKEFRAVVATSLAAAPAAALDALTHELRYNDFAVVKEAALAVQGQGPANADCAKANLIVLLRRPDLQSRVAEALLMGLIALDAKKSGGVDPDELARILESVGVPSAQAAAAASSSAISVGAIATSILEYAIPAGLIIAGVALKKPGLLKTGVVYALGEGATDAASAVVDD